MSKIITTPCGQVQGTACRLDNVTAFKGIRYATAGRWEYPTPVTHWDGIYDAYKFAPISMQDQPGIGTDIYCREWHVDPDIPMNEDCLYLNEIS